MYHTGTVASSKNIMKRKCLNRLYNRCNGTTRSNYCYYLPYIDPPHHFSEPHCCFRWKLLLNVSEVPFFLFTSSVHQAAWIANVVAPVTPTICSAEHATTHQWTSSCLSSACNKGLLADVLFIKPLSPDLSLCVFPLWGYLSMMKCSTLTLAQEATHGKFFPVSTESLQTLVQNFIIRFQHSCQRWGLVENFSHGGLYFLHGYVQSNCSEYLILKMKILSSFKACHCLPVRQGLTFSGTLVFILTCALCCILCFDVTGFYAKQETKCLALNYWVWVLTLCSLVETDTRRFQRYLLLPSTEYRKSDVWLTVHRNSVWIRKTN